MEFLTCGFIGVNQVIMDMQQMEEVLEEKRVLQKNYIIGIIQMEIIKVNVEEQTG